MVCPPSCPPNSFKSSSMVAGRRASSARSVLLGTEDDNVRCSDGRVRRLSSPAAPGGDRPGEEEVPPEAGMAPFVDRNCVSFSPANAKVRRLSVLGLAGPSLPYVPEDCSAPQLLASMTRSPRGTAEHDPINLSMPPSPPPGLTSEARPRVASVESDGAAQLQDAESGRGAGGSLEFSVALPLGVGAPRDAGGSLEMPPGFTSSGGFGSRQGGEAEAAVPRAGSQVQG